MAPPALKNPYIGHADDSTSPTSNYTFPAIPSNVSSPVIVRQMRSPVPAPPSLPPGPSADPLMSFPYQAPPSGLTIRLKPLAGGLAALDNERGSTPPTNVQQDLGHREATRLLQKHRHERMPYVQLASRRLHAVLGEKNEWEFGKFLYILSIFCS